MHMPRSLSVFTLFSALTASLAGCAQPEDERWVLVDGAGPQGDALGKIYYGDSPNSWEHDAVVALHEVYSGSYVYREPFCSGTLITDDVVLTAAHCLDGMRTNQVAVYVGDNPAYDLSYHLYTASDVQVHPSYNRRTILNDIALLTLSSRITESVSPVSHLPSSSALDSSDIGSTVNFAGFGVTEHGSSGVKLQIDGALGGFGCSVSGCTSRGDTATQVSYNQHGGGPCVGDSGGPMFVYRGSSTYVGGVTSYGDAYCRQYGVSTRVDAYTSWIDSYAGTSSSSGGSSSGGGTTSTCTGYDETWSDALSGAGEYNLEPGGSSYYAARGTHKAYLTGPADADFDLYLYRYDPRRGWVVADSSTNSTSEETISYRGRDGNYIWMVYSYSGGGGYTLCTTTP